MPASAATLSSITPLETPLKSEDEISNSGQVIFDGKRMNEQGQSLRGYYYYQEGGPSGWSYYISNPDGTRQNIGFLPDPYFGEYKTNAHAMNNLGQVVGSSGGSAFFWSESTGMIRLGSTFSFAYDINDKSQVVGSYGSPGRGYTAFLYAPGKGLTTVAPVLGSGGYYNSAIGINEKGQVVGTSYKESYNNAFLYSDGIYQNLNSLILANSGWILESAIDINDVGQIIGSGLLNGQTRSFLLTPIDGDTSKVPESTSALGILLFGTIGVGWMLTHKRLQRKLD